MMTLDPRLIFLLTILCSIALASFDSFYYYILLAFISVLYIISGGKKYLFYICYGLVTFLLNIALLQMNNAEIFAAFGIVLFLLHRFVIMMLLVDIMRSFSTGKIISALIKMRISIKVIIPIIIALRYFPEIKESLHHIQNAIKIRKLKVGILHPFNYFRYISIPLIHKSLNTANEIAEAITVKGIEYHGERSCYHELKLTIFDFIVLTVCIVIFIGAYS